MKTNPKIKEMKEMLFGVLTVLAGQWLQYKTGLNFSWLFGFWYGMYTLKTLHEN